MKHKIFFTITLLVLQACSTTKFIRYEEGELVESQRNLKKTKQTPEYKVSFDKKFYGERVLLQMKIIKNEPIKEEWEDIYSKVGIYEKRCRGWKNWGKYCEFDGDAFFQAHIAVFGFFYDLAIPFLPYNEEVIEVKDNESGSIVKEESRLVDSETFDYIENVKLTINGISSPSNFKEETPQFFEFEFTSFKISSKSLPHNPNVNLDFNGQSLDVSTEFSSFVREEISRAIATKETAEKEAKKPENKYKLKYCSMPNLFQEMYHPSRGEIEPDCLYVLGGPLKVVQVVAGGVLVVSTQFFQHAPDKIFFVKTAKPYVDDDLVKPMFVRSSGIFNYTNVMGAGKSIHSFQFLGDANLERP